MGGIFDDAGLLLALNELVRSLILVAGSAATLLAGEAIPRREIWQAARAAVTSLANSM